MIVTSSDVIIDGVNRVFDWFQDGFPGALTRRNGQGRLGMLRHDLKLVEDKGVAVKFRKVQQN
jgi:hypothetical protein